MIRNKRNEKYYGDEAPRFRDVLLVLGVTAILIALSWFVYYKLHWFH
jgi:hypothetical protein